MVEGKGYLRITADAVFLPGEGLTRGLSLLVKDGVLEKIAPSEELEGGEKVVDLQGFTISPPFCDYHLHFSKDSFERASEIGKTLWGSGIAEVFEGGDCDLSGMDMKQALSGRVIVKVSGAALYKRGCYGKRIGRAVHGSAEARAEIDRLVDSGVDYLKILNSGVFLPESGGISAGGFDYRELKEIIAYVREKGLAAVCHANGDRAIRDAVNAGASAVVHGFHVSDDTLSLMAERGVALIPTIRALKSLKGRASGPEAGERIDRLVDEHLDTISLARAKGIRVLPGSDASTLFLPHGASYLDELMAFRTAGLSTEEVLSTAVSGTFTAGEPLRFLILRELSVEGSFRDGTVHLRQQEVCAT